MLLPRELPQATPRDSYRDLLNVWARASDVNRKWFREFIETDTAPAVPAGTNGAGTETPKFLARPAPEVEGEP